MTVDGAEQFFDAIAGRYDRAYGLPATESRERMARTLRELPAPPARVLDLGVGTGRELAALLDGGYEPIGVDTSQAMLDKCARRARPVPLVRADFWSAPLPFEAEVPCPAWLDRLDAYPAQGDRRVRRTGPSTCVYEDLVTGASIEARLFDETGWRAAFGPPWHLRVELVDEVEWFVVARRA